VGEGARLAHGLRAERRAREVGALAVVRKGHERCALCSTGEPSL
jgi:hypothetical protein